MINKNIARFDFVKNGRLDLTVDIVDRVGVFDRCEGIYRISILYRYHNSSLHKKVTNTKYYLVILAVKREKFNGSTHS